MKIITHEVGGTWMRFPGTKQLSAAKVTRLVHEGVWDEDDLAPHGLKAAEPFLVPAGKACIGAEYFNEDGTQQLYAVEDISPPDRVTARQFKLQLHADDLLEQVDNWIAMQDASVQIAWETSGTFVRSEPMLQAGFAALGFSELAVDDFFRAAAEL